MTNAQTTASGAKESDQDANSRQEETLVVKESNELDGSPVLPPEPPPEPSFKRNLDGGQRLQLPEARKSSIVSFKEVCELFEVDLEANGAPQKPAALVSLRYWIMILALVSPFVVTYSRTIINFAITDMIDPNFLSQQQTTTITTTVSPKIIDPDDPMASYFNETTAGSNSYFDSDNSCPVDEETRAWLDSDLKMDKDRADAHHGEKFEWDTVKQGLLKAAYAIGHMLLQVMGGRLSEIYGSHLIMGVSSSLIGLCCLLAPFLASAHFYLLFTDLLILGMLGSFMSPALITLFTHWLTPSEKSMTLSLYLVSSRLGYALSSVLCGLLIQAKLSWRYLFYSAGWVSLAFSLLFSLCARSWPHLHPLMGQQELDYLASKNTLVREAMKDTKLPQKGEKMKVKMTEMGPSDGESQPDIQDSAKPRPHPKPSSAPWLAILTNAPVWAFIITKFCVKLAGDTVQIELPTYLKRVMHFTPRHNGFVNASNYVIFCLSCLLVGALAKWANKRRPFGWTKTTVRKVFQMTASSGACLSLLGISLCVCQETGTLIFLMLMFFFTTFSTGGEAQIPLDISERYAGTIHAIGGSLAISGAIEPILVGYILRGHSADRDRWANVWMGASGVALIGGLVFLFFGDATIQPFDSIHRDDNKAAAAAPAPSATTTATATKSTPATKMSGELDGYSNGTFQRDDGTVEGSESAANKASFEESAQI